jgi:uncharacterized repeat protein (TIGR01451 family)
MTANTLQTSGRPGGRATFLGRRRFVIPLISALLLAWPAQARQEALFGAEPGLRLTGAAQLSGAVIDRSAVFEPNVGQVDMRVKFLSRASGYVLYLTDTETVLDLAPSPTMSARRQSRRGPNEAGSVEPVRTVVRMKYVGGNPRPVIVGGDELPGKVNYFRGDDPTRWRRHVPTYATVTARGVYPGVDVVYYGGPGRLEYDFVVAPGADPRAITLAFQGPENLTVNADGDLLFKIGGGELRMRKPLVYQDVDGSRKVVPANYVLKGKHRVGLRVAAYDRTRPLIIDPVLVYSTYLGGSGAEVARGISADPVTPGIVYVAGETSSTNFPTTAGFQPTLSKGTDCFVAKFDTNQSGPASRVYSTYLGGSGTDQCYGVAVDGSHNAYVVGRTTSTNFPLATKLNGNNRGGSDGIVVKLNASGSALLYSVYIGGSADEAGFAIAVDGAGQAYVTGSTTSTNFPVVGGFQTALGDPSGDAFVTKINAAGNAFLYSSYLGGNGIDQGQGIAVDPVHAGVVYVTGDTSSTNLPTKNGFQLTPGGNGDAFVAKVDTGSTGLASLLYSSYLGGSGPEHGRGITTDGVSAYVTGQTASANLYAIVSASASPKFFDAQLTGPSDAFVARVDSSAVGQASVGFFTYLGGGSDDAGNAIAVDTIGNVYVTGQTFGGFPVTPDAFQPTLSGGGDAFVARLNTNATGPGALIFGSYLGGSGTDEALGLALDSSGNGYMTGTTSSTSAPSPNVPFPTTVGSFQPTYGGGTTDAFVVRVTDIAKTADLSITKSGPASVNAGDPIVYSLSVSNGGPNTASTVVVSDALPNGTTLVSAGGSGWACSGTTTVTCTRATLAVGAAPGIVVSVTAASPGTLVNSASVTSATPDPASANNTSAAVQTTVVAADLSITKTGPASVNASAGFSYTLTVSNAGPNTASSVSVSDLLPSGTTLVGASGTGWNCSGATTVTCTRGSLAVGTAPSIGIAVTAPAEGTTLSNAASVSATGDPNSTNNISATVQTTVTPQADLSITKSGPASVNVTSQIGYTLTVSNAGPSTASAVSVSDALPTGTTLVSASGTGWSCGGSTTVSCTRASLAVGSAPSIVILVTAPAEGTTLSNSASVSSTTSDPNTANNTSATVQTVVKGPPIFTFATSYQVNEGSLLTFQVTASDPGGMPLTFSASNLPLGANFDPSTQTFAWTPNPAQGGPDPYLVYFTASDGQFTRTTSVRITVVNTIPDRDGDGVPDDVDNCPDQYNPDQFDVCHNSAETVTAASALSQSGSTQGPLNLTFTATLNGGTSGTYFVPVNLFNTICRVTDGGGHPVPIGAVPEGPPITLSPSPNGVLVFIPAGSGQDSTTTFDLKLLYPNLTPGTYTISCDYVNFAHIPQPAVDDPTIWRGIAGAQSQTVIVGLYAFTGFASPADHEPFNVGRTVPVKFSLIDSSGAPVTTATARLFVQQLDSQGNKVGPLIPATSNNGTDNLFRLSNNQYVFNMSTDALTVGLWQLVVKLDNGTTETIVIVLR